MASRRETNLDLVAGSSPAGVVKGQKPFRGDDEMKIDLEYGAYVNVEIKPLGMNDFLEIRIHHEYEHIPERAPEHLETNLKADEAAALGAAITKLARGLR